MTVKYNKTAPGSPPDLQVWVKYYGGYDKISWDSFDRSYNAWEKARRDYLGSAYSRADEREKAWLARKERKT